MANPAQHKRGLLSTDLTEMDSRERRQVRQKGQYLEEMEVG